MSSNKNNKNDKTLSRASTTSCIRLVKNESSEAGKDASEYPTKKPNSLVSQLQLLADSIDAEVKAILEL